MPFNRASQIWAMNPNGDARTAVQITSGRADGRAGIAPLPDSRVGYVARMGDDLSVWLMNADGSNAKQLINEPPNIEELRAAPDGRFFIFAASSDGTKHLFRVDANGSNLKQLTFGDSSEVDSTVSPDGKSIVYDSSAFGESYQKHALWKISADGGEPIQLSETNCLAPHFSPDGKFVSCVQNEERIFIISTTDGSVVKTFEALKYPILNVGARWTPDGQALTYIVNKRNVSNLWLQPIGGGEQPRPLTDFTSGEIYNFAFSSDGSRLYLARGYQIRNAILIKNFR